MNPELVFEASERSTTTGNIISESRNLLLWRNATKQFPHCRAKAQCIPTHWNCVFLKNISWDLSDISFHFRKSVNVNTIDLRVYQSWTLLCSSLDRAYVWSKSTGLIPSSWDYNHQLAHQAQLLFLCLEEQKHCIGGEKLDPGFLPGCAQ